MPQQKQEALVSKFDKGLIGSANPMDFPLDAADTIDNFEILRDGSIKKRPALTTYDHVSHESTFPGFPSEVFGYDIGDLGDVINGHTRIMLISDSIYPGDDICIVVGGTNLYQNSLTFKTGVIFYRYNPTTKSLSYVQTTNGQMFVDDNGGLYALSACETPYGVALYTVDGTANTHITIIRYDVTTNKMLQTFRTHVLSRDWWGFYDYRIDEADGDFRGAVDVNAAGYAPQAQYNIINQGFTAPNDDLTVGYKYPYESPTGTDMKGRVAPIGKNTSKIGFILRQHTHDGDVYYDFHNVTGVGCTYFAGKVFYWHKGSTIQGEESNDPDMDSVLFFSKTMEKAFDGVDCRTHEDPTDASDFATPYGTDGGYLIIEGAGSITHCTQFNDELVVFAENGTFVLSGGSTGFNAIDYKVSKLSSVTLADTRSVINVESSLLFFGDGAVYAVAPHPQSGRLNITDLTSETLADKFNDFADVDVHDSLWPFHDKRNGVVRWIRSTISDSIRANWTTPKNTWTSVALNMSLTTGAFWTSSWELNYGSYISGATSTQSGEPLYVVLSSYMDTTAFPIFSHTGLTVTVCGVDFESATDNVVQIVERPTPYNLATFADNYEQGVEATVSTGASSLASPAKLKTPGYLTFLFNQTESAYVDDDYDKPSSCRFRVAWDFATDPKTGKYTKEREAYRLSRLRPEEVTLNYGYNTVVSKNKLMGRGRAMRIILTSPAGKFCHLYGWHTNLRVNTEV